ncbi:hypothetical protein GLOTRDRAFT_132919 [Gloeophyllum trabeum ATCC 11539]|uniref:Uncharacterized protein n=1 Tax=Gloeophyllum trabeum (strain ATCC 11539 / FP-39264 / Madison 617) TaxID=670483 RepID=S7PVM6_GLOTA|nr:uncharacterized protein GLOTRDRAFT_132919 [Gloeophyllum trabeum ATCC 11539]EPQ51553.1 hypothetical protein GLOTRDRAFT_132919 [Gloeophyllum trabeum ATCC 11539]
MPTPWVQDAGFSDADSSDDDQLLPSSEPDQHFSSHISDSFSLEAAEEGRVGRQIGTGVRQRFGWSGEHAELSAGQERGNGHAPAGYGSAPQPGEHRLFAVAGSNMSTVFQSRSVHADESTMPQGSHSVPQNTGLTLHVHHPPLISPPSWSQTAGTSLNTRQFVYGGQIYYPHLSLHRMPAAERAQLHCEDLSYAAPSNMHPLGSPSLTDTTAGQDVQLESASCLFTPERNPEAIPSKADEDAVTPRGTPDGSATPTAHSGAASTVPRGISAAVDQGANGQKTRDGNPLK